jgi:HAD superfamily phosphoserine phosphatase-like hydrolase
LSTTSRSPFALTSPGWVPPVRAALELLVPGRGGRVAALDFDGTCVHGDVSETALVLLGEDTGEDLFGAYEAACAVDLRKAYVDFVSVLCAGRTETEVHALARRTATRGVVVRPAMRELAAALASHGWEVWIVTASPTPLVQAVAPELGVSPDHVLGMDLPIGSDGRYVGGAVKHVTWKEGKVEALDRVRRGRPDLAMGDTAGDVPMLERADTAVWFDHGKAELAAEAASRGWLVQPAHELT